MRAQPDSWEYLFATLTMREHQIVYLVAGGLSNRAIGERLNLAEGTIKVHLHNIYQKLAITNRTMLAALFASSGHSFAFSPPLGSRGAKLRPGAGPGL